MVRPRRVLFLLRTVAMLGAGARVSAAQRPASSPGADTSSGGRAGTPASSAARAPAVVEVAMIDAGPYGMAFSPVRVTARLGDTLRFVQRGRAPHNVVFRGAPPGADLNALGVAREGPLLQRAGAAYDVVLDRRFRPGRWVYVCAPHEVLGMAGTVTVQPAAPQSRP